MKKITIGILGFQGDLEENIAVTKEACRIENRNGHVIGVRYVHDLEKVDGLIIPGGESTVIGRLASMQPRMWSVLKDRISKGMPVMGTCAGLILLSKRAYDKDLGETKQQLLGSLDVVVERNAFGRQKNSFETEIEIRMSESETFPIKGVFIRSPVITECGSNVEVISKYGEHVVGVRQNNIIGVAFHPELSSNVKLHSEFIEMASMN